MKTYRDLLHKIAQQENNKLDEAEYMQRRREDFQLWLEVQLFSELFWRKKVEGKLYEPGAAEEIIRAYAQAVS